MINYERQISDSGVLCYVDGYRAYFTTQLLTDQWGDDWNDAPYEHNAGCPYGPRENNPKDYFDGKPKWHVFYVYYDGPFETPASRACGGNSAWSVQDINGGQVAWLLPSQWSSWPEGVREFAIPAGTPYAQFRDLIAKSGGAVYEPRKNG